MSADGEFTLLPVIAEEQPRLLLEAYTRGRHAAQVRFRTDNPYRDDRQMADAWQRGWESADGD